MSIFFSSAVAGRVKRTHGATTNPPNALLIQLLDVMEKMRVRSIAQKRKYRAIRSLSPLLPPRAERHRI